MSSTLLAELQALTVLLPEESCFVPEWGRSVTLRGFTVAEGRKLRAAEAKTKKGDFVDPDGFAYKTIAHSIVDGADRPLANDAGVALIEGLSEATSARLIRAINALAGEREGNSTGNGATSSDSQIISGEALPN